MTGLQTVGVEVVVLVFDPQNPDLPVQTSVTNAGEGFLKATGALNDFAVFCKGW